MLLGRTLDIRQKLDIRFNIRSDTKFNTGNPAGPDILSIPSNNQLKPLYKFRYMDVFNILYKIFFFLLFEIVLSLFLFDICWSEGKI